MQRKVNFTANQQVTLEDYDNLGNFPRESLDNVVKDLGGFPVGRYSGFVVEQTGQSVVRVSVGRLFASSGAIFGFDAEGGQTLDFLQHLPAVSQRIATVIVYGNTINTDVEPRTQLVDVESEDTQGVELATENRRQAYVDFVLGQENATPQAPAIQSNYIAVANVLLTPSGVASITRITANEVTSIYGNSEQIADHSRRFAQVGPQIDTLKTDISGLAAALRAKADFAMVSAMSYDLARVKERVDLPDDHAAYGSDIFWTDDESDTAHPDYSARTEQGLRFPSAAEAVVALELDNPIEDRVIVNNGMALPKFSTVIRLSANGKDGEYPLTNTTVQTVQLVQRTEARTVRRYSTTETQGGSNDSWWKTAASVNGMSLSQVGAIFKRNGELYEVVNYYTNYDPLYAYSYAAGTRQAYERVTLRKFTEETMNDYYTDRVVSTENVTGSIVAQTMLNSQDGYLVGFNWFFTRKASAGDVRYVVCEMKGNEPDLNAVLVSNVVPPASVAIYPAKTEVRFKPIFQQKGKRYAVVLMSNGAHFVATVAGNKLAQGNIQYMIDGSWIQGDPSVDMAFEAVYASFTSPIVQVSLKALELAGGIDSVKLNLDALIPDGSKLDFDVRVGSKWVPLAEAAAHVALLSNLPSILPIRANFIGTTDVMPALGLGEDRTEVTLSRPDEDLCHISTVRTMPAPMDEATVTLLVENWDSDDHDIDVVLLTGGSYTTTVTPSAQIIQADPARDNAVKVVASFTFGSPVSSFKIKITGETGGSARVYHVSERVDVEFT